MLLDYTRKDFTGKMLALFPQTHQSPHRRGIILFVLSGCYKNCHAVKLGHYRNDAYVRRGGGGGEKKEANVGRQTGKSHFFYCAETVLFEIFYPFYFYAIAQIKNCYKFILAFKN